MQKTCKFNFYNTQRAKEGGKAHWGQANAGELFWKFFVNVDKIQAVSYTHLPAGGSMCVMAEGSVFEKSTLYVKKLTEYIERYLQREMGISCCILSGENTTLVGTAVAALTQEA